MRKTVLVLFHPGTLSQDQRTELADRVHAVMPDQSVLILDQGIRTELIHSQEGGKP